MPQLKNNHKDSPILLAYDEDLSVDFALALQL